MARNATDATDLETRVRNDEDDDRELMTDGGDPQSEGERLADAIDRLAETVREDPGSTALSGHFHRVRTFKGSQDRRRNRKVVALLNWDEESDEWEASVSILQTGEHYRNPSADLLVSSKPFPFLSSEDYGRQVSEQLRRKADAERNNAVYRQEDA